MNIEPYCLNGHPIELSMGYLCRANNEDPPSRKRCSGPCYFDKEGCQELKFREPTPAPALQVLG